MGAATDSRLFTDEEKRQLLEGFSIRSKAFSFYCLGRYETLRRKGLARDLYSTTRVN